MCNKRGSGRPFKSDSSTAACRAFFREDRLKDWENLFQSDIRDDPENKGLKNRIRGIDKKMENILQNLEDVVSKALTKRLDELTRKKEELESKLKNDKCTDKDNER